MTRSSRRRFFSGHRSRRFCCGQASIEYVVVLAFSVIILLRPFSYNDATNPNAATTEAPALAQLASAIKDYHKHYTYAMAVASIPDCDYQTSVDISKLPAAITSSVGTSITVGTDICVDWSNPAIPGVSFNGLSLKSFAGSIASIISDTVTGAVDSFLHPNIGSMLSFHSPF